MKRKAILPLVLSLVLASTTLGDVLNWVGSTDLLEVSRDNVRSGRHSLLFDTTDDANPTSRSAHASVGGEMEGILEGWLLDDPMLKPVWITFGNDMKNCIGVQLGNQANYLLRVGGTDRVDTQVPRMQGWVGFRLEFDGKKTKFYISEDDGDSWEEVGESKAFGTFNRVYLRNNENTGKSKMAAHFDDMRVMDLNENPVLFEGFGGDADFMAVSPEEKLPSMWGRIRASR